MCTFCKKIFVGFRYVMDQLSLTYNDTESILIIESVLKWKDNENYRKTTLEVNMMY